MDETTKDSGQNKVRDAIFIGVAAVAAFTAGFGMSFKMAKTQNSKDYQYGLFTNQVAGAQKAARKAMMKATIHVVAIFSIGTFGICQLFDIRTIADLRRTVRGAVERAGLVSQRPPEPVEQKPIMSVRKLIEHVIAEDEAKAREKAKGN